MCASDSFKGKKLSLGRIPSGTPAPSRWGRILRPGLGEGLLRGPLSPPSLAFSRRPWRHPLAGEGGRVRVTGELESQPPPASDPTRDSES